MLRCTRHHISDTDLRWWLVAVEFVVGLLLLRYRRNTACNSPHNVWRWLAEITLLCEGMYILRKLGDYTEQEEQDEDLT